MHTLIFATNNLHKIAEIKAVLNDKFKIITLKEAGIDIDIPEPHDTFQKNASEKSNTIYQMVNKNCFSEDSGLEVEVLNGQPGVKSARFAGDDKNNEDNINKLLNELKGKTNRKACFRTVISLLYDSKEYLFEGACTGNITHKQTGTAGFGYDPVFIPEGSSKTFAQMTLEEKSIFSHRKKALDKLINFLNTINAQD